MLVTDEAGHRLATPIDIDLATQRRRPEQTIRSILDPAVLGIDPRTYLDKEAA